MSHDISYMITSSGSETASWGHELTILVSASHLLVTINCSSNFAIYCAKVTEKNRIDLFIKTFLRLPKKHMFYFLDFKTRRKIIGCRTAHITLWTFSFSGQKVPQIFLQVPNAERAEAKPQQPCCGSRYQEEAHSGEPTWTWRRWRTIRLSEGLIAKGFEK